MGDENKTKPSNKDNLLKSNIVSIHFPDPDDSSQALDDISQAALSALIEHVRQDDSESGLATTKKIKCTSNGDYKIYPLMVNNQPTLVTLSRSLFLKQTYEQSQLSPEDFKKVIQNPTHALTFMTGRSIFKKQKQKQNQNQQPYISKKAQTKIDQNCINLVYRPIVRDNKVVSQELKIEPLPEVLFKYQGRISLDDNAASTQLQADKLEAMTNYQMSDFSKSEKDRRLRGFHYRTKKNESGWIDYKSIIPMQKRGEETLLVTLVKDSLTINDAMKYFVGVINSLKTLYLLGQGHRDIKPGNIRVGDGIAYLIDFSGLMNIYSPTYFPLFLRESGLPYHDNKQYMPIRDKYALAITLIEMLIAVNGKNKGQTQDEIRKKTIEDRNDFKGFDKGEKLLFVEKLMRGLTEKKVITSEQNTFLYRLYSSLTSEDQLNTIDKDLNKTVDNLNALQAGVISAFQLPLSLIKEPKIDEDIKLPDPIIKIKSEGEIGPKISKKVPHTYSASIEKLMIIKHAYESAEKEIDIGLSELVRKNIKNIKIKEDKNIGFRSGSEIKNDKIARLITLKSVLTKEKKEIIESIATLSQDNKKNGEAELSKARKGVIFSLKEVKKHRTSLGKHCANKIIQYLEKALSTLTFGYWGRTTSESKLDESAKYLAQSFLSIFGKKKQPVPSLTEAQPLSLPADLTFR